MPGMLSTSTAIIEIRMVDVATSKLGGIAGRFARLGSSIAQVGLGISAAFTVPLVAAASASVTALVDFDRELRRVQTISKQTEPEIQAIGRAIRDMSVDISRTVDTAPSLANALYSIVQRGYDSAEAMHLLEVATKTATAGLIDTTTAADAIGGVLSAYTMDVRRATRVADVLFAVYDRGTATFEEIASQIGDFTAIAAQLNIPLEEAGALFATLTLQGFQVAEAATYVKRAFMDLAYPTDTARKAAVKYGVEIGSNAIRQKGFTGLLKEWAAALGGNDEALRELTPNVRAFLGVIGAMRGDFSLLDDTMDYVYDSVGAMGSAFVTSTKSSDSQLQNFRNTMAELGRTIGESVMPSLLRILEIIKPFAEAFGYLPQNTRDGIIALGFLLAVVGPLAIVFGLTLVTLSPLIGMFGKLATLPFRAISTGLGAVGAGGVIARAGLLRAAGGIALLYTAWVRDWGGIQTKTRIAVKEVLDTIGKIDFTVIEADLSAVKTNLGILWDEIIAYFSGDQNVNIGTITATVTEVVPEIADDVTHMLMVAIQPLLQKRLGDTPVEITADTRLLIGGVEFPRDNVFGAIVASYFLNKPLVARNAEIQIQVGRTRILPVNKAIGQEAVRAFATLVLGKQITTDEEAHILVNNIIIDSDTALLAAFAKSATEILTGEQADIIVDDVVKVRVGKVEVQLTDEATGEVEGGILGALTSALTAATLSAIPYERGYAIGQRISDGIADALEEEKGKAEQGGAFLSALWGFFTGGPNTKLVDSAEGYGSLLGVGIAQGLLDGFKENLPRIEALLPEWVKTILTRGTEFEGQRLSDAAEIFQAYEEYSRGIEGGQKGAKIWDLPTAASVVELGGAFASGVNKILGEQGITAWLPKSGEYAQSMAEIGGVVDKYTQKAEDAKEITRLWGAEVQSLSRVFQAVPWMPVILHGAGVDATHSLVLGVRDTKDEVVAAATDVRDAMLDVWYKGLAAKSPATILSTIDDFFAEALHQASTLSKGLQSVFQEPVLLPGVDTALWTSVILYDIGIDAVRSIALGVGDAENEVVTAATDVRDAMLDVWYKGLAAEPLTIDLGISDKPGRVGVARRAADVLRQMSRLQSLRDNVVVPVLDATKTFQAYEEYFRKVEGIRETISTLSRAPVILDNIVEVASIKEFGEEFTNILDQVTEYRKRANTAAEATRLWSAETLAFSRTYQSMLWAPAGLRDVGAGAVQDLIIGIQGTRDEVVTAATDVRDAMLDVWYKGLVTQPPAVEIPLTKGTQGIVETLIRIIRFYKVYREEIGRVQEAVQTLFGVPTNIASVKEFGEEFAESIARMAELDAGTERYTERAKRAEEATLGLQSAFQGPVFLPGVDAALWTPRVLYDIGVEAAHDLALGVRDAGNEVAAAAIDVRDAMLDVWYKELAAKPLTVEIPVVSLDTGRLDIGALWKSSEEFAALIVGRDTKDEVVAAATDARDAMLDVWYKGLATRPSAVEIPLTKGTQGIVKTLIEIIRFYKTYREEIGRTQEAVQTLFGIPTNIAPVKEFGEEFAESIARMAELGAKTEIYTARAKRAEEATLDLQSAFQGPVFLPEFDTVPWMPVILHDIGVDAVHGLVLGIKDAENEIVAAATDARDAMLDVWYKGLAMRPPVAVPPAIGDFFAEALHQASTLSKIPLILHTTTEVTSIEELGEELIGSTARMVEMGEETEAYTAKARRAEEATLSLLSAFQGMQTLPMILHGTDTALMTWLPTVMHDVGVNAVDSFVLGLLSGGPGVAAAPASLVRKMLDAWYTALGISSPSRETIPIGEAGAEGFWVGMLGFFEDVILPGIPDLGERIFVELEKISAWTRSWVDQQKAVLDTALGPGGRLVWVEGPPPHYEWLEEPIKKATKKGVSAGLDEVDIDSLKSRLKSAFSEAMSTAQRLLDRPDLRKILGFGEQGGIFAAGANGPFEDIYRILAMIDGINTEEERMWADMLGMTVEGAQNIGKALMMGIWTPEALGAVRWDQLIGWAQAFEQSEQLLTDTINRVVSQANLSDAGKRFLQNVFGIDTGGTGFSAQGIVENIRTGMQAAASALGSDPGLVSSVLSLDEATLAQLPQNAIPALVTGFKTAIDGNSDDIRDQGKSFWNKFEEGFTAAAESSSAFYNVVRGIVTNVIAAEV